MVFLTDFLPDSPGYVPSHKAIKKALGVQCEECPQGLSPADWLGYFRPNLPIKRIQENLATTL
jgi:hypothetical protein